MEAAGSDLEKSRWCVHREALSSKAVFHFGYGNRFTHNEESIDISMTAGLISILGTRFG